MEQTVTVGASVIQSAGAAVGDLGDLLMHASTNCVDSVRYVVCRTGSRRSAGVLVRSFEA